MYECTWCLSFAKYSYFWPEILKKIAWKVTPHIIIFNCVGAKNILWRSVQALLAAVIFVILCENHPVCVGFESHAMFISCVYAIEKKLAILVI